MTRNKLTVHSFRSSFCDCAADRTNFPREIEMANTDLGKLFSS
jgi:hypothetical protein